MIEKLEDALTSAFPPVTIDRAMLDEPTANWSVVLHDATCFLRYLLHERESFNDLPFQLAGQLTRRTDVDNKKLDRRLSRLTTAQRAAVGEMLAYLATVAPMDEIMGRALATWNKEGE